ncbi:MAG: hypothetical protein R2867_32435 [Caldilineaceae bacterium]
MSTRYISAESVNKFRCKRATAVVIAKQIQRYVLGPLEIDRIIPVAAGGTHDEINLWLYHQNVGVSQLSHCNSTMYLRLTCVVHGLVLVGIHPRIRLFVLVLQTHPVFPFIPDVLPACTNPASSGTLAA